MDWPHTYIHKHTHAHARGQPLKQTNTTKCTHTYTPMDTPCRVWNDIYVIQNILFVSLLSMAKRNATVTENKTNVCMDCLLGRCLKSTSAGASSTSFSVWNFRCIFSCFLKVRILVFVSGESRWKRMYNLYQWKNINNSWISNNF